MYNCKTTWLDLLMLFLDVMQKEKSISTGTENLTQVFDHKPSFTHNLSFRIDRLLCELMFAHKNMFAVLVL